jgi:hypothetical protein
LVTVFLLDDCSQERIDRTPTAVESAHGDVVGPDTDGIKKKMARHAVCVEGTWEDAAR